MAIMDKTVYSTLEAKYCKKICVLGTTWTSRGELHLQHLFVPSVTTNIQPMKSSIIILTRTTVKKLKTNTTSKHLEEILKRVVQFIKRNTERDRKLCMVMI